MFAASIRLQFGLLALLSALALAVPCSAGAALPGGYASHQLTPPAPAGGERFGQAVTAVGDGYLAVGAPGTTFANSPGITGEVSLVDAATGGVQWKVHQPIPQPESRGAVDTGFGSAVVELGDIGACNWTGSSCQSPLRVPDGWPEVLVSAPGGDVGGAGGADQGIVYVLDGQSGRVIKRIVLPVADRPTDGSLPGFGKSVLVPSGMPPCDGHHGIGACPAMPAAVAIGDLDGQGVPDVVVGAPDFIETADNPGACTEQQAACPGTGRVFVFRGEDIGGSALQDLNTALSQVPFFEGSGSGSPPHFGSALSPLGDVGTCNAGSVSIDARCYGEGQSSTPVNVPDGVPDFMVSASGADTTAATDAGAAFVIEGAASLATARISTQQPGPLVVPGTAAAFGDVGGSALPDLAVGAPVAGSGAAWVLDGDVGNPGGLPSVASLADVDAQAPGGFGASVTALGNVAGDSQGEVAVGRTGAPGAVQIFSACKSAFLQQLRDPGNQADSGFGATVAPAGDVNGDGYLDIAVATPGFSGTAARQGAVQVFESDGAAAGRPVFAGCNPLPVGGGTGGGGGSTSGAAPAAKAPTVTQRTRRSITFRASSRVVKRGRSVRITGEVKIGKGRKSCRAGQKVALQRLQPNTNGFYLTFDVAVTSSKGKFSLRIRPDRTFTYRVRLVQNRRCDGAVSGTTRVVIVGPG